MDSKPVESQNPDQEKAPRKKRVGCLILAAFLALALGFFMFFILAGLAWIQVNRPLPESPNFKPSPAVLELIKSEKGPTWPSQPAIVNRPGRADRASTSVIAMAGRQGASADAPSSATRQQSFELIPERELDRPEFKTLARQFNESFRKWVDELRLYEENPAKFKETLQAGTQTFGPYPQYGYLAFEAQLARTPLESYRKTMTDTCLQLLIHYQNWEAASDLCRYYEEFYSWDETLYALRQIPKPLVKYARIVVWSGGRMVQNVVRRSTAEQK